MTAFDRIVRTHAKRYPLMQPQDYGKLVYQSEFGPEHMIADEQNAAAMILAEWQGVSDDAMSPSLEPIGNGLCRFHMTRAAYSPQNARRLSQLFIQSARQHTGTRDGLEARIAYITRLPVDGMSAWLSVWREAGCPPVHHTEAFHAAYRPHYRILLQSLADSLPVDFTKAP